MNFEYFIARKYLKNQVEGKKVSRPIVKISIISISLAVLVNIITVAVVIGFKNEVSNKVLGFGSHAFAASSESSTLYENEAIQRNPRLVEATRSLSFIKNVQPIAYKPAILQSDKKQEGPQEIQSMLVKGVDERFDFQFFKKHLKKGKIPHFGKEQISDEIILSAKVANNLGYQVGDRVTAFFVKNQPLKKFFRLAGIFETGMEDFDKQIMLCDIRHIQQLNDWGIQSSIRVLDTLVDQYLVIKGIVSGGNGNYRYDWGKGYEAYPAFTWYPEKDTVFRLIASDYWMFINGKNEQTTIPDTAYLKVHINSSTEHNFPIQCQADGTIRREYLNESGTKFRLFAKDRTIDFEMIDGQGSHQNYIGAYEFNFHSWDHFDEHLAELKSLVNFNYSSEHQDIRVSGIKEQQQEIFIWLGFLDINVWIIISLMLLIGIINMGSAMLVLILLRTPVIGLLKAMGSNNWSVRKVFLYQVAFLILKGMFWGNLIGLGLCLIQDYFQVIKLNPAVYYLNAAPIELNWISILLINLLTIFICLIAMLIPSLVISRIHPAKSIKFN